MSTEGTSGNVLLVEDNPEMVNLYKTPLISAGYKVEVASTGSEGYAKILQGGYDFILLDIMLPDLNGIDILKSLNQKKDPQSGYNGPIIILSQLEEPQIIESAIKNGAKGYLIKASFTPDQLLSKVSEIIKSPA